MGGKVWTGEEETVFWGEVTILAPPGHDSTSQKAKLHSEIEQSWEPVAEKMKREMLNRLQPGEKLRRTYTAISCYEHYFQNYVKEKYSPNARPHVEAYTKQLKKNEEKNERDAMESSGAPTPASPAPAGPKPAGPKHAVASKKRKAKAQCSGHQGGHVTADDLDRMTQDLQRRIDEQKVAMSMPFPAASQPFNPQGRDGPVAQQEVQETAVPADSNGALWTAAEIARLEDWGLRFDFGPMSTTPATQPFTTATTAPRPPPPMPPVDCTNVLPSHFDLPLPVAAARWYGNDCSFVMPRPAPAPAPAPSLHSQGYFDFGQGDAVPHPSGQTNAGFLDPAVLQWLDPAAAAPATAPATASQPTFMQQYEAYRCSLVQNGEMMHGYQPQAQQQQQSIEMVYGHQDEQRENAEELARLAAYTNGDGSGDEYENDDDKNDQVESEDERPSKRQRLHG